MIKLKCAPMIVSNDTIIPHRYMKKEWLFMLLILSALSSTAQRKDNPCVYEYLLQENNQEETLKLYRSLYDFRAGDAVASIGAGSGSKEVVYSMMADSLVFYLQDIDSTCLTSRRIKSTITLLYSAAHRTPTATFITTIGTEKGTKLPIAFFDKAIIENTLHELTYPKSLLQSIHTNLKKDGFLYIQDLIARKPGEKHRGCKKPLFTEQALVQLLDETGFRLLNVTEVFKNNAQHRSYKFSVAP